MKSLIPDNHDFGLGLAVGLVLGLDVDVGVGVAVGDSVGVEVASGEAVGVEVASGEAVGVAVGEAFGFLDGFFVGVEAGFVIRFSASWSSFCRNAKSAIPVSCH